MKPCKVVFSTLITVWIQDCNGFVPHYPKSFTKADTSGLRTDRNDNHKTSRRTTFLDYSVTNREEIEMDMSESNRSLPFQTSIGGSDVPLLYSPFYEWHLSFLQNNLSNLRPMKVSIHPSILDNVNDDQSEAQSEMPDFSYNENVRKQARVYNQCFSSKEFRKIRMTYYDAGPKCQVFNALWYPHYDCDLPVLGIDLLAFGGRNGSWKYLTVMDFQPMLSDEASGENSVSAKTRDRKYEQKIMHPIRSKYPNLQGQMSNRFYDSTEFFSSAMLYGRFEDASIFSNEVFPAFQEYVTAYTKLIQNQRSHKKGSGISSKTNDNSLRECIQKRQADYDIYNAERDPAKGMFENVFGKEWAEEFVHGFLFSNSVQESVACSDPHKTIHADNNQKVKMSNEEVNKRQDVLETQDQSQNSNVMKIKWNLPGANFTALPVSL